ncbi:SMR family transporter [Deinococcus sp.]|uniref:DMT family transporter n=1 Tax=Deinococcus sp. TaxID=47478 RepID=UPI0025B9E6AA|nr:SMR family transporter [Deinococcus sp.]
MRAWTALLSAIALEVTGTLSLKVFTSAASPGLELILTYGLLAASYVLLSRAFRQIPVAVAFAVWEAAGLILITGLGALILGEHLRPAQLVAMLALGVGAALLHRGTRPDSRPVSSPDSSPVTRPRPVARVSSSASHAPQVSA